GAAASEAGQASGVVVWGSRAAAAGAAARPLAVSGTWSASRLQLRAVQPSRSWTWKSGVPRERTRSSPCRFLSSPITPSASAIRCLCAQTPRSLLQRARAATACRWASRLGSPSAGSIVGLRRDVGDEAAPLDTPPDPFGGEARGGADRGQFGTGKTGAAQARVDPVA